MRGGNRMFMTEKKTKRIAALGAALLLGVSLLFNGCSPKQGAGSKDRILTMGFTNAPSSWNPLSTPDVAAHFINRFMFDTLLGQPEVNKFTPHLALSIDTKDKQTYMVRLNPKAHWSDGKPITADDLIFTLNLAANPKVVSSLGRYINFLDGLNTNGRLTSGDSIPGLKKVDDHTVEFKCKNPIDPNIVKGGLGFNVPLVPKHIFSKLEYKNIPNAPEVTSPKVFSGPYKFVKYVTNDHMELVANDKYVLGTPKIKRLFLTMTNATNMVVGLKAGKIQINCAGVGKIPIKELDGLKADKKLKVVTLLPNGCQFLMANNAKFDLPFRRALAYAVNRQQIKDQLFKGYVDLTPTMYGKNSGVFDPDLKMFPHDPEKAREELKKSKVDLSQEFTLMVPLGNLEREQSGDLIQQDLKNIGLNVKIMKMDFPTLLTHARKAEYQLLLIGVPQPVDPDYSTYFTPGSLSNYSNTDDPELVAMFEKGIRLTDFKDRKKVYFQIQKYLRDNQFQCLLYNSQNFTVKDKNLAGGENLFFDGVLDDIYNWHFKD